MNDDDLRLRNRLGPMIRDMRPVAVRPNDEQRAVIALQHRKRAVLMRNAGVIAVVLLFVTAVPLALTRDHGTHVRTDRGTAGQPAGGPLQLQSTETTTAEATPGAAASERHAAGRTAPGSSGSATANGAGSGPVPAGFYVRIKSSGQGLIASRYHGSDERVLQPDAVWFRLSPDRSHALSSCAGTAYGQAPPTSCTLYNTDVASGRWIPLDRGQIWPWSGAWSRDGSMVLYSKNVVSPADPLGPGTTEVWAVPAAGGLPHKVATGTDGVWSPDSTRVAYVAKDFTIHIVDVGGSGDRGLFDPSSGQYVSGQNAIWGWSPDGSRLILVEGEQTTQPCGGRPSTCKQTEHVLAVDPDTGEQQDIGAWQPLDWMPDGRSIVAAQTYSGEGSGYTNPMPLAIVDVAHGSARRLADVAGPTAAVSLDGRSVAYGGGKPQSPWDTVHVVSVAGTDDKLLGSANGWDVGSVEWSPDGAAVVWTYGDHQRGNYLGGRRFTVVQRVDGRGTWHLDG